MPNYSFETLSPVEFENISRDLLQKEFGIHIESFTSGRDGGIDLRHAPAEDSQTIIQSKRHLTSAKSLIAHLKSKELAKVIKLKPARYILTTSVGLTPANKDEILTLFRPYIKSTADIYGKDDLNNLLGKYPDIEKQHYKLWLSSIAVLQQILHTDIVNRTMFEEDDIKRVVSLYVENDSYAQALDIFSKNRFVIISGVPGIGKTTLARMMVFRLLADGEFEQFVYVSRGVEEAIKLYSPGKKQLFFFDDFLGRNYFEKGFGRNEENDLVQFIERIAASKNKGLILTTREYILRQAQHQYASLDAKIITDSKYVIDLEKYTKIIRARILYNHLFAHGIPYAHLAEFLENQTYHYIISHKNYTPRLIETVLKEKPWEETEPNEFPEKIKHYFDEPNKLWEDAYINGISENARKLLKVLFTVKSPITIDHLYAAFDASHRDSPVRPDYHVFEKTVKELENTFIDVKSSFNYETSHTLLTVDYKNPSVLDFFLEYFSGSRRNDLLFAVTYPAFIDQLIYRFVSTDKNIFSGQLVMTKELSQVISKNILSGYDKLPFCEEKGLHVYTFSTRSYHIDTYPQVMHRILNDMGYVKHSSIRDQLYQGYLEFNKGNDDGDFNSQTYLLELFQEKMTDQDIAEAIWAIIRVMESMQDYEWLVTYYIDTKIGDVLDEWRKDNDDKLEEKAIDIAIEEMQDFDLEELENHESSIDYYQRVLGLDTAAIGEAYDEALYEARRSIAEDHDYDDIRPSTPSSPVKVVDEDKEVREIFDSLRQN